MSVQITSSEDGMKTNSTPDVEKNPPSVRKRGRPPKIKTVTANEDKAGFENSVLSPDVDEPAVKRKRGRPPKNSGIQSPCHPSTPISTSHKDRDIQALDPSNTQPALVTQSCDNVSLNDSSRAHQEQLSSEKKSNEQSVTEAPTTESDSLKQNSSVEQPETKEQQLHGNKEFLTDQNSTSDTTEPLTLIVVQDSISGNEEYQLVTEVTEQAPIAESAPNDSNLLEHSCDLVTQDTPVVKRKRGRPKIIKDSVVSENEPTNDSLLVKRKRGRPRIIKDVTASEHELTNDSLLVKKKRGRPKIIREDTTGENEPKNDSQLVKKKRGRPKIRKDSTASENEMSNKETELERNIGCHNVIKDATTGENAPKNESLLVERKRGRPKIRKDAADENELANDEPVLKGKRDSPNLIRDANVSDNANAFPLIKRKIGRPPKLVRKRGRPRKVIENLSSEDDITLNKLSQRSSRANVPSLIVRRRGRPPKSLMNRPRQGFYSHLSLQSKYMKAFPLVHRSRGRPRKHEVTTNESDSLSSESSWNSTPTNTPPRKRGRPPKPEQSLYMKKKLELERNRDTLKTVNDSSEISTTLDVEEQPIRKRGRPRKQITTSSSDSSYMSPTLSHVTNNSGQFSPNPTTDASEPGTPHIEHPIKRKRGRPRKLSQSFDESPIKKCEEPAISATDEPVSNEIGTDTIDIKETLGEINENRISDSNQSDMEVPTVNIETTNNNTITIDINDKTESENNIEVPNNSEPDEQDNVRTPTPKTGENVPSTSKNIGYLPDLLDMSNQTSNPVQKSPKTKDTTQIQVTPVKEASKTEEQLTIKPQITPKPKKVNEKTTSPKTPTPRRLSTESKQDISTDEATTSQKFIANVKSDNNVEPSQVSPDSETKFEATTRIQRKSCIYKRRKKSRNALPTLSNSKIENLYIADGFRDDCEKFIQKCMHVSKINFEKFCEIWKEMEFACVFRHRQTGAELAELSEEIIFVAKSYMIASNRHYEENVVGLFLVYGFLNLQPYEKFAVLRITPEDVPAIKALEAEARRQRRLDVLYILGDVLIRGPCHFHVCERDRGIEMPLRKYFDGTVQVTDANSRVVGVISKTSEAVALIKSLATLDHKYLEAKKKLQQISGQDPSLNYTTSTAAELEGSVRQVVPDMASDRDITGAIEPQQEERHEVMRSIKDKAMTNVVNPIKHLSGIDERNPGGQSTEPVRAKCKGKGKARMSAKSLNKLFHEETPTKTKEHSPKKTTITIDETAVADTPAPKPPRTKIKYRLALDPPKVLRTYSNNKQSDASRNTSRSSKDSPEKANESNLNDSNKTNESNSSAKDTDLIDISGTDSEPKKSLDLPSLSTVNIDTDAVIVLDPSEKDNEVEQSVDKDIPEKAQEGNKTDKPTQKGKTSVDPNAPSTSNTNLDMKKLIRVRKKDRRECKRSHIKSKFKKLGILSVANFEGTDTEESS